MVVRESPLNTFLWICADRRGRVGWWGKQTCTFLTSLCVPLLPQCSGTASPSSVADNEINLFSTFVSVFNNRGLTRMSEKSYQPWKKFHGFKILINVISRSNLKLKHISQHIIIP